MKEKPGRTKKTAAAICNLVGGILLTLVILLCIPATLPQLFGYQGYAVVSGSMEPAIPTGGLVYVKETEPEHIQKEDVIAFYSASDTGAVITHRVVKNQVVSGQFITKGDANEAEDVMPIPYELLIGKVVCSIPLLGNVISLLVSVPGKAAALGMVLLAAVLHIIAGKLQENE